jgi:hypothetical protein
MNRHPQWEQRLVELVEKRRFTPYEWGRHDCLLFAGEVVKAITGKDHARKHRGKYKSHASAYSYLKSIGHDSAESFLDGMFDEKPVGFAQRGDIVMEADGIPMLCMGAYALSVGQEGNTEGLVGVPRERWVKAWAVGDHHSSWPDPSNEGR